MNVPPSPQLESLGHLLSAARAEVAKVIIGQEDVIDLCLVAVFTGNHVLLEGVPGIAKTLLVRSLAQTLSTDFSRIQFTPDLMPADITGTNIFNLHKNEFFLSKGPVFTTFLLADEVNRAPAKTQSALLQAMQERTVTIDRDTYSLSPDFTVFATQNPLEFEGTYPLPEAQKDRFMLKIVMHPPNREAELLLARRTIGADSPEASLARRDIQPVIGTGDLVEARSRLNTVLIREEIVAYIVDIVRKTRSHESVLVGAGPRGTQALLLASRAIAALRGRDFVTPDDVKFVTFPCLGHRIVLRPEFEVEGVMVSEVVEKIVNEVTVPR
ncbi:MAG: magnesium chelatase [Verrucomicrobiales bacterium]|nr:magnesium chelatase [Verrucomicrobiales bacterium]